jgi:hypothetical protein
MQDADEGRDDEVVASVTSIHRIRRARSASSSGQEEAQELVELAAWYQGYGCTDGADASPGGGCRSQ